MNRQTLAEELAQLDLAFEVVMLTLALLLKWRV